MLGESTFGNFRIGEQSSDVLLKTIKMPENADNYFLTYLSDKLPIKNYVDFELDESKSNTSTMGLKPPRHK